MDTEKILENLSAMGCDEKEICFMKKCIKKAIPIHSFEI